MNYSDFYKSANEANIYNFDIVNNNSHQNPDNGNDYYDFDLECYFGASLHPFNVNAADDSNDSNGLYVLRPGMKFHVEQQLKANEDRTVHENAVAICIDTNNFENTDNIHAPLVVKPCIVANEHMVQGISTLDNTELKNVLLVISLYNGHEHLDHYYVQGQRDPYNYPEDVTPFYSPFADVNRYPDQGANFREYVDYLLLTREDFDIQETANTFNKQILTNHNSTEVIQLSDNTNAITKTDTSIFANNIDFVENKKQDISNLVPEKAPYNDVISDTLNYKIRKDQEINAGIVDNYNPFGVEHTIYYKLTSPNYSGQIYAQDSVFFSNANNTDELLQTPINLPSLTTYWKSSGDTSGAESGHFDNLYQPFQFSDYKVTIDPNITIDSTQSATNTNSGNTIVINNKGQEEIVSHETAILQKNYQVHGELDPTLLPALDTNNTAWKVGPANAFYQNNNPTIELYTGTYYAL